VAAKGKSNFSDFYGFISLVITLASLTNTYNNSGLIKFKKKI